jgi:hypothetical protein
LRHTRMVSRREFRGFFVSRWDHRERQGRDALLAAPSTLFRGSREAGYFRTRMGARRAPGRRGAFMIIKNPAGATRKLEKALAEPDDFHDASGGGGSQAATGRVRGTGGTRASKGERGAAFRGGRHV